MEQSEEEDFTGARAVPVTSQEKPASLYFFCAPFASFTARQS